MPANPRPYKVLLLGGSSEASALAARLADDPRFDAMLSLAGRTTSPGAQSIPRRVGGFGGAAGLVQYLDVASVDALVVALHPFAIQMRANAMAAADMRKTPLIIIDRPCWRPAAGDRWTCVADMAAAAHALGTEPKRVLLTVGRQELTPFKDQPQHAYLTRSIDAPSSDDLPRQAEVLLARGPFTVADEQRLLRERNIDIVVTKNAGAGATEAKLVAARALALRVIMVNRPPRPPGANDHLFVPDVHGAWDWLVRLHQSSAATDRGV